MHEFLSLHVRLLISLIYILCIPLSLLTIYLMAYRWRGRFTMLWKFYFFLNFLTALIYAIQLYIGFLQLQRGIMPGYWINWSGWLILPLLAHLGMFYARSAAKGVIWDLTTWLLILRIGLMAGILASSLPFLPSAIYSVLMLAQAVVWLYGFILYLFLTGIFLRDHLTDYSMLQALHLSPFGIWALNESGEELFANAKMEEIFENSLSPQDRGSDWVEAYTMGEKVAEDTSGKKYLMIPQETILGSRTSTIWSFSEVTEHHHLLEQMKHNSELLIAVNEILEDMLTSIDKSLQAQEASNMARHIHDVLAQELSIVGISVETLARKQESSLRKEELVEMVNSLLMRLERRALMREEEKFSSLITAFDNIGVRLLISGDASLSYLQEHTLFLILREAATNAVRHGGADIVEMVLSEKERQIRVDILNNGTAYKLQYEEGMGIQGMREKVERLGGAFALHAEKGYLITILLPSLPSKG